MLGRGEPGVYNLAADGLLTMSDLADALGWYSIPVPELGRRRRRGDRRAPPVPPTRGGLAQRVPLTRCVMDTTKARRELRWRPRYDARETLDQMVAAAREALPGLQPGSARYST